MVFPCVGSNDQNRYIGDTSSGSLNCVVLPQTSHDTVLRIALQLDISIRERTNR